MGNRAEDSESLVSERGTCGDGTGVASNRALLAIGYKELISYLQSEITYERAVDLIKQKSRNYAKRQLTWFRRESEANFIDMDFENTEQTINIIYNDIMKRWKNE